MRRGSEQWMLILFFVLQTDSVFIKSVYPSIDEQYSGEHGARACLMLVSSPFILNIHYRLNELSADTEYPKSM